MLKIPPVQYWRKIVSRGKYPLLLIYELNQGLLKTHQVLGFRQKLTNYCRVNGASYLYEPEVQRYIALLRQVLKNNPRKTLIWLKKYYKLTNNFFSWLRLVNKKLTKQNINRNELKKLYQAYEARAQSAWRWGYLPFLIDDALAAELNDLLISLKVAPRQIPKIIKYLSASPKLTLGQQQEVEILNLAQKVKKLGLKKCRSNLMAHLNKWGWKNSWLYTQHPVSFTDLEKEVLLWAGKKPKAILQILCLKKIKNIKQKNKLLVALKNKKLSTLAKVLGEYTRWHTTKMEELTKIVFEARPLFIKLAKIFGLTYEQFTELYPREVADEQVDKKIIKSRIKDNGILMLNGKIKILTPAEIKQATKTMALKPRRVKELKGFSASTGQAIGKVAIVPAGNVNIKKISVKPGAILVASMTTQNMMPLIKKAAAIVTDEGGLLCHAAIISRELGIPCIVGTKIATKVLRDGDLIKVDANSGIVRKLN